jgi:hypothetical protein
MTILLVAMDREIVQAHKTGPRWSTSAVLPTVSPRCLAVDQAAPNLIFCGTYDQGLWRSRDTGATWEQVGEDLIESQKVTAVSIQNNLVYAGTQPSELYRSDDGGDSWQRCPGLNDLPSATTWAFPPNPSTHHVRWITIDPLVNGRVYVCIEAGALVYTEDGGQTWHDRVPNGPYDTHILAAHLQAPDRLYAAAGDGYYESSNGGHSWQKRETGLDHRYAWGLALHPQDPNLRLVSTAAGPRQAHDIEQAQAFVYRRTATGPWQLACGGLPHPQGTTIASIVAHPHKPGHFYLANNHGLFYSNDAGLVWERLEVPWTATYRRQRVHSLIAIAQ